MGWGLRRREELTMTLKFAAQRIIILGKTEGRESRWKVVGIMLTLDLLS